MKTAKIVSIAIQIMGRVIGIVASQMNSGKQKMFRAERKVIMTENDALKIHKEDCKKCKDTACEYNHQCLQKKDIEVYEEIIRYRALGTVEEIQKAMENLPLLQVEHKLLQEYQNIGTVRLCRIAVERMKEVQHD